MLKAIKSAYMCKKLLKVFKGVKSYYKCLEVLKAIKGVDLLVYRTRCQQCLLCSRSQLQELTPKKKVSSIEGKKS